jgi:hypothetical protein
MRPIIFAVHAAVLSLIAPSNLFGQGQISPNPNPADATPWEDPYGAWLVTNYPPGEVPQYAKDINNHSFLDDAFVVIKAGDIIDNHGNFEKKSAACPNDNYLAACYYYQEPVTKPYPQTAVALINGDTSIQPTGALATGLINSGALDAIANATHPSGGDRLFVGVAFDLESGGSYWPWDGQVAFYQKIAQHLAQNTTARTNPLWLGIYSQPSFMRGEGDPKTFNENQKALKAALDSDPNNRLYIALYPSSEVGYAQIEPAVTQLNKSSGSGIPFSFLIDVTSVDDASTQIDNVQNSGTDFTNTSEYNFKGALLWRYDNTTKYQPTTANLDAIKNFKPLPENPIPEPTTLLLALLALAAMPLRVRCR